MSTSAGHTTIPDSGEEDVVPEERKPVCRLPQNLALQLLTKQKPDQVASLATPFLSPSTHAITPESDVSPASPHSSSSKTVRVVNGEIIGMENLAIAPETGRSAPAVDLHGADVPMSSKPSETSAAGFETGRLATGGDTAGTNYGPNLGFPFPNSEFGDLFVLHLTDGVQSDLFLASTNQRRV